MKIHVHLSFAGWWMECVPFKFCHSAQHTLQRLKLFTITSTNTIEAKMYGLTKTTNASAAGINLSWPDFIWNRGIIMAYVQILSLYNEYTQNNNDKPLVHYKRLWNGIVFMLLCCMFSAIHNDLYNLDILYDT